MSACHNTTTDQVTLDLPSHKHPKMSKINQLQKDLTQAQHDNQQSRLKQLSSHHLPQHRSCDWAQTRPEWGLAGNSAFIVGPRTLTQGLDLRGQAFLHSYDYQQDLDGKILTGILTAPMIVAQWINAQYLFSALDNVAYGAGSKITHNITGKIGVMQGNGSDLMHGLPLQSVMVNDKTPYHLPQRLMVIIYAPCEQVQTIINNTPALQKLVANGWISVTCLAPENHQLYFLDRKIKYHQYARVDQLELNKKQPIE